MVGTQFRCAEPGGAPAPAPAAPAPAPVGTDTVTPIPTGLVTATGTAGDGSAAVNTPAAGLPGSNSGVPFVANGPVPGATGTASAGTSAGATHVLTTSLATRNVMALGSAIVSGLTALILLGQI